MNSKTNQNRIYKSVASRGYGPEAQGLTPDQFTARQIVKLLEEAMEAAAEIYFPHVNATLADLINEAVLEYGKEVGGIEAACKSIFDNAAVWKSAVLMDNFLPEFADIIIPVACAATAQHVSAMALGADKVTRCKP